MNPAIYIPKASPWFDHLGFLAKEDENFCHIRLTQMLPSPFSSNLILIEQSPGVNNNFDGDSSRIYIALCSKEEVAVLLEQTRSQNDGEVDTFLENLKSWNDVPLLN